MPKYDALVSFRTTKQFKARLEAQARSERMSVSQMVVRAMEAYLAGREDPAQAAGGGTGG